MRWLAIFLVVLPCGCSLVSSNRATQWLDQVNPFANAPSEKVVLKTYLLDQPAGDPYLTHDLWTTTLKPLAAEKQALMMENGLRVGQFTGNPPYQFLTLARTSNALVKPMQYTTLAGEPKPIALNGPLAEAKFQAYAEIGAKPGQFALKDAEAAMNITAAFAENGKVKLTLEPRVQHGSRQLGFKPTNDATAFTWLDQKIQERFPSLKFEVTMSPEEFLLVGPSETPANTLGGTCFVSISEQRARMRVLVIQVAQFQPPDAASAPLPGKKAPTTIAAQASQGIARGQQP